MKGLSVAGTSPLHKLTPGLKLGALAGFALLAFSIRAPLALLAVFVTGIAAYASVGLPWRTGLAQLRPLCYPILLVGLFGLLFHGPMEAATTLMRLSALLLAASAVTLTTPVSAFMEAVSRAARPLERLGLADSADIGLAAGLAIRFVPEIVGRYGAIREAHIARGIRPRFLTLVPPLIVQTLRDADNIAAAIDARGVRGPRKTLGRGAS